MMSLLTELWNLDSRVSTKISPLTGLAFSRFCAIAKKLRQERHLCRIAYFGPSWKTSRVGVVMQKTVLSFGETLWDLLPYGPALGGAPFNFACRVNSLGDRGIIISRIGRDDYGRKALEQIAAFGMEIGRAHV